MKLRQFGGKLNSQNGNQPGLSKAWIFLGFLAFVAVMCWPSVLPETMTQNVPERQLTEQREPDFTPSPQPPPDDNYTSVPDLLPPAPGLGEAEHLRQLHREEVLSDPLSRINEEFQIPKDLEPRVRFWFDIYTKHSRFTHVLHHDRFPWIVYEVLDFSDLVKDGKGPEWLKVQRSKRIVAKRRAQIGRALKGLARHPNGPHNALEKRMAKILSQLPGRRAKVYRLAATSLRSQLGQRDYFISGLRRSSRYLPYLEETFFNADLPLDLTRMPFVESSFNEQARSKVGASGIWQVMPNTGKIYGTVGETIDERNSPFKATAMAARLLKSYRKALGSWPLAITAYNHGIGNIQIAIRHARSRELPQIIERYHERDFKFASSNFYTCFLAALYAERYSEVVFPSVVRDPAQSHEKFMITRHIPLYQLIKQGDLNLDKLLSHNLDLNQRGWKRVVLPKGFVLHLPRGHGDMLPERLRARMRMVPSLSTRVSERDNSQPDDQSI
jgi:membrane-bound lytic murein transglycosylase D